MFGLFKKKTEVEKLQLQYEKLLIASYSLSKSNRSASDAKMVEAEAIQDKIAVLNKQ